MLNDRALGLGNLNHTGSSTTWAPPSADQAGQRVPPMTDGPVSTWDKGIMTVSGTASATITLLVLILASATVTWISIDDPNNFTGGGMLFGALIIALIAALVGAFKPRAARIAAPVYALAEGVVLGAISRIFDAQYDGIVLQAVGATLGVFTVMLLMYRSKIIRVTDKFRRIVIGATLGLMVFYLASFIFSLFGATPSFINGSGAVGILFSVFVAGLAAFNLALDFDMIERAAEAKAPSYMEWYCALSLTVTLVWLYLEILRLLAKLREN